MNGFCLQANIAKFQRKQLIDQSRMERLLYKIVIVIQWPWLQRHKRQSHCTIQFSMENAAWFFCPKIEQKFTVTTKKDWNGDKKYRTKANQKITKNRPKESLKWHVTQKLPKSNIRVAKPWPKGHHKRQKNQSKRTKNMYKKIQFLPETTG